MFGDRNLVLHEPDHEDFVCPVCLNILLEPTTLTCGHNVCRGCLASWYLSNRPRRKECPTCRQQWVGSPQVNTALRNVIERREKNALQERRAEVAENPEYQTALNIFEAELRQTRRQEVNTSQNSAFFAGMAVTVLVCVIICFILYWRADNSGAKGKPVATWGASDVSHWLRSMGWAHNYSINAEQHTVDGPTLLYSNEDEVLDTLEVTAVNHRSALRLAIGSLKKHGVMLPHTIWEYKELYPGRALYFSYALKDFPRSATVWMYLFYYEDTFLPFIHTVMPREWGEELKPSEQKLPNPERSQMLMFILFMLVFPYGMVGLFTWSLRSAHTITHLVVIATCIFQTIFELTALSSCRWSNWKAYLWSHGKQLLSMVFYVGLWPICPSFLGSFFFYVCLYASPFQLGKKFYESLRHH